MITICTTTLQVAAELKAAGIVVRMYDLGRSVDGNFKCLVVFSKPVSTQFLEEVTMSHKTKAAVATAAHSCASYRAHYYGDNSTHILKMQAGGAKW